MAASTFVPAPRTAAGARVLASAAAARTAPRGAGLAPVIALPVRGASAVEPDLGAGARPTVAAAAAIHLVPVPGPTRTRPRAVAVALVVATVVLALSGVVGAAISASSGDLDVAGHVVLQPGETLWDVAVRSAPAGVDPRRQLDALRRINGFGPGALDAWTVVLIPAR
jgi:hypothetical protein